MSGKHKRSLLVSAAIVAVAGVAVVAPADVTAQANDMSERLGVYKFEQRLDRVRRDAARMEKIVTKGWKPASRKKEDRYRNATHQQLDELQKQARTEKRRLKSPSAGMFSTSKERSFDYRDLEYTLRQMEQQLQVLQTQVEKMEEGRAGNDG